MKNEENKKKKLTLREKLKDKREKAKLELMLYGIFFVGVIIFSRVLSSYDNSVDNDNINQNTQSFITAINDNYEYDMKITFNDKIHEYYGMVLGNNSIVNVKVDDEIKKYYMLNKKYYILEDNNYILVDEEEVYPYVNYRYLNINNIKEYMKIGINENDVYKIRLSDIVLNNESTNYFTITLDEGDKSLVIDYTELFKLIKGSTDEVVVNISYDNIGKIISLSE